MAVQRETLEEQLPREYNCGHLVARCVALIRPTLTLLLSHDID